MHRPSRWNTPGALKFYAARASLSPNDWERRFNWDAREADGSDGFSQAEMDAIYAEVIAKIPAGVTRVLDLGCGDGRFGNALTTARPTIEYRGVDLVPSNIERAQSNYASLDFVPGNLWEYLSSAPVDWDFVVSIGCLFSATEDEERLFELLDAKASKGFIVLAEPSRLDDATLATRMATISAASTTEVASYATGARDFLLDATLKGILRPFYIQRAGTSTSSPAILPRMKVIEGGRANQVLERTSVRLSLKGGGAAATEFKGFEASGGLVNSINAAKSVDPTVAQRIPPRRAPIVSPPVES
jgi:SAM-dependent methyltransferase